MASSTRVIARLDVKGPNLIKGIQFDGYRVLGSPEQMAKKYYQEGIDELFFQDSVASLYQRNSLLETIKRTAQDVFIPMTVAGGLRSIDDIRSVLRAGADKVAINTAAVARPELIREAAQEFGSQCIVASIEVYSHDDGFHEVWTDYGRQPTGIDAIEWSDQVEKLGAGEIFLTSINREGTGRGYQIDLTRIISERAKIPVVAAGGAGNSKHVIDVIKNGKADAVAIASVFHYHYAPTDLSSNDANKSLRLGAEVDTGNFDFIKFGYGNLRSIPVEPTSIREVKSALLKAGTPVRLDSGEIEQWRIEVYPLQSSTMNLAICSMFNTHLKKWVLVFK